MCWDSSVQWIQAFLFVSSQQHHTKLRCFYYSPIHVARRTAETLTGWSRGPHHLACCHPPIRCGDQKWLKRQNLAFSQSAAPETARQGWPVELRPTFNCNSTSLKMTATRHALQTALRIAVCGAGDGPHSRLQPDISPFPAAL